MFVCLTFLSLTFAILTCHSQETFSDSPHPGIWPSAEEMQVDKKGGEMLEALLDREEERCYGKKCFHSEECCKGAACVDIEGVSGTCLPIHGREFYQPCQRDADCGFGLVCADSGNFSPSKTCQLDGSSILKKKGFNDECITSSDCDTDGGLCCQVMRRHRMAPKKLCYYFQDPQSCVGRVVTSLKPMNYIPNPFFKARLG